MCAGNDIEINTFSIDIEMYKDISIDIEILIYDPFTNWFVPSQLIVFKRIFHKHSTSSVLNYYSAISKFVTCPSSPVAFLDNFKSTSQLSFLVKLIIAFISICFICFHISIESMNVVNSFKAGDGLG